MNTGFCDNVVTFKALPKILKKSLGNSLKASKSFAAVYVPSKVSLSSENSVVRAKPHISQTFVSIFYAPGQFSSMFQCSARCVKKYT